MRCKIADLIVEIPAPGGMAPRCAEYRIDKNVSADIVIRADNYHFDRWPQLSEEHAVYMESGNQFYRQLLNFQGMMLHASAVELDGYAYLFSGPSGMGKSTHTRLWKEVYGNTAHIFNDDKPALRRLEGQWYAYGTPWSGKHGINENLKAKLAGICFLRRGTENTIKRLGNESALKYILSQTIRKFRNVQDLDRMLTLVDDLIREIPVYEFFNRPEPDAAMISYAAMRRGVKEMNL